MLLLIKSQKNLVLLKSKESVLFARISIVYMLPDSDNISPFWGVNLLLSQCGVLRRRHDCSAARASRMLGSHLNWPKTKLMNEEDDWSPAHHVFCICSEDSNTCDLPKRRRIAAGVIKDLRITMVAS